MHSEAELIAQKQLQNLPDPNIQRMLAESLIGQYKFRQAFAQLSDLINFYPDDVASYEILSRLCLLKPNEFGNKAEFWLDEAVRKNPSSAMAYILRGTFELQKNNMAEADKNFEYAQKLDLSDINTRLALARELINAGQLKSAAKHLEIIENIQPTNKNLWNTRAMLASKSGLKTEMVKVAKNGLNKLVPSNLDFMPIAAGLFIDGEDFQNAEECMAI